MPSAHLAQLNIDQLADEGRRRSNAESAKSPLLLALIAGVCIGSVLAGIWSGDHVELGILPLGAFGVALEFAAAVHGAAAAL